MVINLTLPAAFSKYACCRTDSLTMISSLSKPSFAAAVFNTGTMDDNADAWRGKLLSLLRMANFNAEAFLAVSKVKVRNSTVLAAEEDDEGSSGVRSLRASLDEEVSMDWSVDWSLSKSISREAVVKGSWV